MTFAERTAAVETLGFTTRQATFLTIVALHGGYCLARQYAAYTDLKNARGVRTFVEGLVERRLAERVMFGGPRGIVYHLFSRRLYGAIDYEHSRNRAHVSPYLMAVKLMRLDFVIAHPDFDWYPTQADRLDLFVTRLGVPSSAGVIIPRVPIFLHGASPCVNFVSVVTDARGSAIDIFVRDHAPLLRHVTDWTLHTLIPQHLSTDQACDAAYRRAVATASLSRISASKEDLAWFEHTRALVTAGDLRTLDVADLRRYRTLSSSLERSPETHVVKPLVVHHLPHSYTQFGFFPGLA